MTKNLTAFIMVPILVLFVAALMVHRNHPERHFFKAWASSDESCNNFCDSYDKNPVLTGNGVCVCDTKTGKDLVQKYTTPIHTDAMDICTDMCNTSGQEYSQVLQYSAGTCICDNKEGNRVSEGYHKYINGQCK